MHNMHMRMYMSMYRLFWVWTCGAPRRARARSSGQQPRAPLAHGRRLGTGARKRLLWHSLICEYNPRCVGATHYPTPRELFSGTVRWPSVGPRVQLAFASYVRRWLVAAIALDATVIGRGVFQLETRVVAVDRACHLLRRIEHLHREPKRGVFKGCKRSVVGRSDPVPTTGRAPAYDLRPHRR